MDGWEQDHPGTVLYCTDDPALTVGSPDDAASPARTAPPGTGPATMATSSAGPLHEPAPPAPPAPPATAAPLTSTNTTSMAPGARPASDATPTPKPRANRKCGPYADSLPSCSIAPALRTHPPGPRYPGDAGMAVSKRQNDRRVHLEDACVPLPLRRFTLLHAGGQVQKHQALSNVFGGTLNRLARLKPARSDPCLLLQ